MIHRERERERERERALSEKMRKKNGFTERESFIRINEKEKWVHKERERELYQNK